MRRRQAPPLLGITHWVGEPQDITRFSGVLVFFTITRAYCLRYVQQMEHIAALHNLPVLGIVTPEFAFERSPKTLEETARSFGLSSPLALDARQETYDAYPTSGYPHTFIIEDGQIVWDYRGANIEAVNEIVPHDLVHDKDPVTPDTYCGKKRNPGLGCTKEDGTYVCPRTRSPGVLYPEGAWKQTDDGLESQGGILRMMFTAHRVYLVASGGQIDVRLHNLKVPADACGQDLTGCVSATVGRPYEILRFSEKTEGELSLHAPPGVVCYLLSFL